MEESKKAPVAREQTTVRMPEELKERLQKEAERRGIGFNELIMIIIADFLHK